MTGAGGAQPKPMPGDVGAVVIGRNEGARLHRCLTSLAGQVRWVVYVDSGSTDGSVARAKGLGAHVVDLDDGLPFTAARARNAGLALLKSLDAAIGYVQFVDGDCEVDPNWIQAARAFLEGDRRAAVAFGRRRERFPDRSIYNRLCDVEWSVPAGETLSCGGDAMMRAEALADAGGYRADLIAGEEPELCVRLRGNGWKIVCLDLPMTLHDAAMTRFSQWWRRSVRTGYAYAQGVKLHGGPPEFHRVKESRRAWIWGAAIPIAVALAVLALGPWGLFLGLVYPLQVARLYRKRRTTTPIPFVVSLFNVLGKFPEAVGQIKFETDVLTGRAGKLIEYK